MPDPIERFWPKIEVQGGCWIWTASTTRNGYPQFNDGKTMVRAARWIYERLVGPIPAKHELHHPETCISKLCVNPDHLEPVTKTRHMEIFSAFRDPEVQRRNALKRWRAA